MRTEGTLLMASGQGIQVDGVRELLKPAALRLYGLGNASLITYSMLARARAHTHTHTHTYAQNIVNVRAPEPSGKVKPMYRQ